MTRAPTLPVAFRIGVRPLGEADWLIVDARLATCLGEKARLEETRFGEIFMAEPETLDAQTEALGKIGDYLTRRYPDSHRRVDGGIRLVPTGATVRLDGEQALPLWTAARLVQEDLVLMRKGESGWRVAAAALYFPSAWKLAEKFGRPMHEVHAPVPDFAAGTRNSEMITRMFDNLRPETPVIRWNWGLYGDDALFHPEVGETNGRRFGEAGDSVFLRLERQTLSRLPTSGDILFTIGIAVDPLAALAALTGGAELARALMAQLEGFTPEQAAYKGLLAEKAALMARLGRFAEGGR